MRPNRIRRKRRRWQSTTGGPSAAQSLMCRIRSMGHIPGDATPCKALDECRVCPATCRDHVLPLPALRGGALFLLCTGSALAHLGSAALVKSSATRWASPRSLRVAFLRRARTFGFAPRGASARTRRRRRRRFGCIGDKACQSPQHILSLEEMLPPETEDGGMCLLRERIDCRTAAEELFL